MLQGRSVGAQPQCPPLAGFGVAFGVGELGASGLSVFFLLGAARPVYRGAAFFGAVEGSSVPVGGGFAADSGVAAGFATGSSIFAGFGAIGSVTGAGSGLLCIAIATATIIAATAIPPPMNRPVLFFCGGAKSAAVNGLGEAPPPNGIPPSGAPKPPSGASPSGAAPSGAGASAAGELACDASALRSISPESSSALVTLALGVGTALLLVVAVRAASENSTLDSFLTPVVDVAGWASYPAWAVVTSSSLPACATLPNKSRLPAPFVVARATPCVGCAAVGAFATIGAAGDAAGAAPELSAATMDGTCPRGVHSAIPSDQTYVSAVT